MSMAIKVEPFMNRDEMNQFFAEESARTEAAIAQAVGTPKSRGDVLLSAHKVINGQRQNVYGRAEDNFEVIGLIWQVMDQFKPDTLPNAANVALKMMGMKLGRIIANPYDLDSARDLCGYAGLMTDILNAHDLEKE